MFRSTCSSREGLWEHLDPRRLLHVSFVRTVLQNEISERIWSWLYGRLLWLDWKVFKPIHKQWPKLYKQVEKPARQPDAQRDTPAKINSHCAGRRLSEVHKSWRLWSLQSHRRILNELMTDFRKLVTRQKEFLDKRSKKVLYPQFAWIEAPLNVNFSNNTGRKKYNDRLHAVSKFHENVTILELKKIWDPDCSRLYVAESDRYTCEGLLYILGCRGLHNEIYGHYHVQEHRKQSNKEG